MKIITTLLMILAVPLACLAGQTTEIDKFLASRTIAGQIYFADRISELSTANKIILDRLTATLKQQKSSRLIRVEGFASKIGQDEMNFDLSMQRALAVKNYLQQHDLAVELFLTGFGEKLSADDKLTEQRRVDIAIYKRNKVAIELFKESGRAERFIIR